MIILVIEVQRFYFKIEGIRCLRSQESLRRWPGRVSTIQSRSDKHLLKHLLKNYGAYNPIFCLTIKNGKAVQYPYAFYNDGGFSISCAKQYCYHLSLSQRDTREAGRLASYLWGIIISLNSLRLMCPTLMRTIWRTKIERLNNQSPTHDEIFEKKRVEQSGCHEYQLSLAHLRQLLP